MCVIPAVAADEAAELQNEINALKQGQEKILEELAALKKLVQDRPRARAFCSGVCTQGVDAGRCPYTGCE
jgi:hypothetical protein